ncbi:MAG: T9SS type A sorting domain-containing protein [Ignavibacterium sp.]|nr:T9SS type A sorting domain-containing protein [Ignavibacterium sp.]
MLWGRTYLASVFLESFYSNGLDTIHSTEFSINAVSEIDFALDYAVDTIKYINGYSLYYRIVAKDKGIVPSYYHNPTNGYYKLVYDPSPAQVLFSQDSIYIPTLGDTGSVKIINTSDHSVRIDSINSVGAFYGYRGFLSKPGFEYPFYLFQTLPGPQWNDTLGIVIPPHDSIKVSFYDVDLCPICDYEVQEYFKDTLRFVFTFMDGNVYSFSNSIPISGEGHPSDVTDDKILPTEFVLEQNYPNPFNPSTKISWQSPVGSWQTLKIYDVLGKEVATLVNEYRDAGKYELEFNAEKLSSGVYYYQLRVGDPSTGSGQSFVETKKMIYLK